MASQVCIRLSVAFCALSTLSALAAAETPPPTTVLYLRVSGEYLSQRFERTVSRTKPVTDLILGTRITGESQTDGKTRLVLLPSADQFQAEVEFVGTVHSKTRGYNGPAILDYESDSTFRATKRITLNDEGFTTEPARADASTRLQLQRIDSRSPGLMGELVKSIARRRVAQTRAQADAIASRHTANIVAADLDRGLEKSLGALTESLVLTAGLPNADITALTAHRPGQPLRLHFRTTPTYVELAMCPGDATWDELSAELPTISGNPHVALRVHRSLATHVATGSSSTPPIARLLLTGLQSRLAVPASSPAQTPPMSSALPARLSFNREYLAIDVDRAESPSGPFPGNRPNTPALADASALGQ